MTSFVTKSVLALGLALVVLFGVIGLSNVLTPDRTLEKPVVTIDAGGGSDTAAEPEAPKDFATLLAEATPEAGKKVFGKCKSCHTAEIGGPNRVGPNLGNVVGAAKGHHPDFAYSDAFKTMGGEWTYDELNDWLTSPSAKAPGNKMSFAGLSKPEDRAAVIAYLVSNTENPPPLPTAEAPAAEAPAADAPATEAPATEAPAEAAPAAETPATEAPAEATPAAQPAAQ